MLRRQRMLFFAVALSAMSACGADKPQVVATESSVVYDFTKQAVALGWSVQNDTVMGGVSESSNTWVDNQMVFSGNLSLENNGGFVSSFGPVDEKLPSLMNGATAIRLRATGDGNTYLFQLRGNDGTNYIQRFTTAAENDRVYVLPLSSFTATDRFLYEMADAPPLDTSNVYQMGLYLLDKQTGPFSIAISSIGVTS
jgi:NADH dehydrogenase [ubiquinone] 1 alpha subcomplex assembly factor 1